MLKFAKEGSLKIQFIEYNFNRYGAVTSFVSMFLAEVTYTYEMYKMLNEFNNEINELKSDYQAEQDEEIDDIIENASLVYNNQLKFFDDNILKNKQKTPTKRISSDKLFKTGSSSSPLSIRFPSQGTISERTKLKT